jgi:hypothetical protein
MLKLNRMCSMTFGRPPLLPNYYLQTDPPADVELEQLAGNPVYAAYKRQLHRLPAFSSPPRRSRFRVDPSDDTDC